MYISYNMQKQIAATLTSDRGALPEAGAPHVCTHDRTKAGFSKVQIPAYAQWFFNSLTVCYAACLLCHESLRP